VPRQESDLPWSIRERNLIDPNCLYTALRSQTTKLTNPGAVIGTCCNDRLAQLKRSHAKHPTERCPQHQLGAFDFCRHQRNSESDRNGNIHDLSTSPLQLLSLASLVQTSRKYRIPLMRFAATNSKNVAPQNVAVWPKADILIAWADVRFRGNSGHRADIPKCLLETQSGHGSAAICPYCYC
jgi:hypothetical protein